MSGRHIIAIDQGTTNTKAIVVDEAGAVVAKASRPLKSDYPQPGWAEQSPGDIWASVQGVIAEIISSGSFEISGIAIANQRETLVVWDGETGQPIAPAILWQCRRTASMCDDFIASGANPTVVDASGLSINALFPATKLAWVMQNIPQARSLSQQGRLRAGTVDSWLLYSLTGGREFATDHSNASRTLLFHTGELKWDERLCALFDVPTSCLPEAKPSDSLFGHTADGVTALAAGIPILTMMGDSHAALFGHGVRDTGVVKATYGTGSSLMTLTNQRVLSQNGLSSTIAWTSNGRTSYALEGNITVSAQAATFAATILGLDDARALSTLAQSVPDNGGVTFVPALAGLGAPYWNDDATGTIAGMTLATTRAHIARATLEAIVLQVADVFTAMERDVGSSLDGLLADGGASTNDVLMQLQADILDRQVWRGEQAEIGAMGVARSAFGALGMEAGPGHGELSRFSPGTLEQPQRFRILTQWRDAVARATLPGDQHSAADRCK
jgi:glycerol kinase